MRSEAHRLLPALTILAAVLMPRPGGAQAPLFLIDSDTRVASVEVSFTEGESLDRAAIRERIGLRGPGALDGIRGALSFLPFLEAPGPRPFSPLEMARDAARIEDFYRRHGFLGTDVAYEVTLDTASNAVDVAYRIAEGRPVVLDSLEVVPSPDALPLAPELEIPWERFVEGLRGERGIRLGEVDRVRLRSRPLDWLRTRGYAFARVADTLAVDSARAAARLEIRVDPGPRSRVDSIAVEGLESLGRRTVLREIPLREGDWFSAGRVAEGQRQIFGLGLVRLALLDLEPAQPEDSTATLRLRVREGSLHLISGELGYATERGAVAQARWEHRDFLGGARTLTLSGTANSGWLAATEAVDRRYGASVALRQPYLFDYRLSGTLRPFVEYRDDSRDESFLAGADASLLFERGSLKRISATWGFSNRRIIDAPTLTARGDTPDTLLLSALPVELGDVRTHRLTLDLVHGEVDDPLGPRRGWIARASTEAAGPEVLSNVQYLRLDGSVSGFLPLARAAGVAARISAGRLLPWGESVPDGPEDVLPTLLRLRDAVFTAGGTGDVRGWATGLLGPKVPDLRLVERGDSTVASADRWLVLSGLARFTASVELRLPFPFLGPRHGTHLFVDAGRVWAPDDRFRDPDLPRDPLGQEDLFFGTGVGVEFGTPVGPLRIDLGYKLNPSPLDLRDPGDVARALVAGDPISSVPTDGLRRWHLHVAVGRVY